MDQFIINELDAQLLKEKEARQEVEEQLAAVKRTRSRDTVRSLLLITLSCPKVTACHKQVPMLYLLSSFNPPPPWDINPQ